MNYTARPSTIYRNLNAGRISTILSTAGKMAAAFRPPQRGESFLGVDGAIVARAEKETYVDPRIILVPRVAAAPAAAVPNQLVFTADQSYPDGVPAVPAGYQLSAFRFNIPGEPVLGANGTVTHPNTVLRKPFYILAEAQPAAEVLPQGFFE